MANFPECITFSYEALNVTSTASPSFLEMMKNDTGLLRLEEARLFIREILLPVICIFGMTGNTMTFIILTRKQITTSLRGAERAVNFGLTALAVSDFLFCMCSLPLGLLRPDPIIYESISFELIYNTYRGAPINAFILTSTWLTVIMAGTRYLAICHPFRTKHLTGLRSMKISIVITYLACLILNIPRFFEYTRLEFRCGNDGPHTYVMATGPLTERYKSDTSVIPAYTVVYRWTYFIVSIVVPFTLLALSNFRLIIALRASNRLRRQYRVSALHIDSNHCITNILVIIVIMYALLVSPGEILVFCQKYFDGYVRQISPLYVTLALEITGVLQTLNYAFNFILYFILNVHFRQTLIDLLLCWLPCSRCKAKAKAKRTFKLAATELSHRRSSSRHLTFNTATF